MIAVVLFATLTLAVRKRAMVCPGYECIPGLDALGIGIDVVTSDFKAQSLFDFSFTRSKTWTNPFHDDLTYSVPDQIEVIAATSSGSTSNVYRTTTEYATSLSHGAGVEGGFGAIFSGSAEVNRAKTFLSNGDTVLSVTEETVKLNSLSLLPPQLLKISDSLANAISQHLPVVYDSRAYATFVSYFGTHYLTSATYGGKATMMSSISNSYLGENSDLVANANAKVHFQQLKGVDVGASFSTSSSSKDYTIACADSWSIQMIGGNSHLNMSQWSDWTDSVKLAPAQISFRVVALDRLMPDEARAVNFRRYLDEYYRANNHTEISPPPAPIRLGRCQCASFPFDGSMPNTDGLLTGLEELHDHLGGTRQYCVPCYTLAGKFGNNPLSNGMQQVSTSVAAKQTNAKAFLQQQLQQKLAKRAAMTNSTCGSLPCLPGVDSIGVGFDVLAGEIRDLRIIKMTYQQQNVWKNPFYPTLVYNYADQLNVVTKTQNSKYSTTYNDTVQYANSLANKAGLQADTGAYSGSIDVAQSRSKLTGSQAILSVLEQYLTLYEVDLAAYPEPSDTIVAMESWLPQAYQPQAYATFVSHFGTHYVSSAIFGGSARQHSTVDQHFFTNNGNTAVAAGVYGTYNNFKAGVKVNRTSSDDMKAFADNSISEIVLLGGNYEKIKVTDWDVWQESTKLSPTRVSFKLHEISELFQDATKAANMKQHVAKYLSDGAKLYKRLAVSTQHPMQAQDTKVPDGDNCADSSQAAKYSFLTDWSLNVPFLHTVLSPQKCRSLAWSSAPRGSTVFNNPLTVCGEYWTNATTCDRGGFIRGATYDVSAYGTWVTPIRCGFPCYSPTQ